MDYWLEAVESSLEEADIVATTEQIKNIAGDMKVSHEQYDMAYGYDVADKNLQSEKDRETADLRKKLNEEIEKRTCGRCNGRGYITSHGPSHSADFKCHVCNGQGRR